MLDHGLWRYWGWWWAYSLDFGNLLINTQNDNTPQFESFYIELVQFHTSFSQLKSSKSITVVNTLADNAFKHQIIWSNETVLPIIVSASYIFNLSTDLRYNKIKFKEVFIDLKASNQSSRGIGQLKALQQLDISF